jgi:D-alanyl-D-alanine carboxypeptidase/D-alanyl-D-alanine-endopeptidase (penicillin-binding protein 4)
MRRVIVTWGVVVLTLGSAPAVASAQPSPAARALTSALNHDMGQIGGTSSAEVVDMTTGRTLYSVAAGVGRLPASVEKIYTTSTALLRFGPTARLTTSVLGTGTLDSAGVWHGVLYLKGGGDPTFGSASFDQYAYGTGATMQRLVANLVGSLHLTGIRGWIVGDQSYFDALRGTPATGFAPDLPEVEGQLGALSYDRGFADFAGITPQARPALYTVQQFAAALRAAHVRVSAKTRLYVARTPAVAQPLAVVQSPPMATLIRLTNTPSDNYFAEMLLKALGARFGGAGTTAAGVAVVRDELSSTFGVAPQFNDGSGLSYSDYTSPRQVLTVLEAMYGNPDFFNSLAIGGETGTLRDEMQGTAAQGVCHGKTGTLHDVANLAGYCRARDGHELAFAFLANGIGSPDYVHAVEADQMAVALAKYNG